MHRALRAGPVKRAPERLAVHRHHALYRVAQRRTPGDETVLEVCSIKRREDQAKLLVGRRTMGKGQKTPQKFKLLLAEQTHRNPSLGAAQDRAKRQK